MIITVENLKKEIPTIQWTDNLTPIINDLRLRKDADAIQKLKDSGTYADKAVEIGIQSLREGITELEVVAKIEYEMKKLGITSMSFDTMVLFGDHAADPHGVPGDRKLRKNEINVFITYKNDVDIKINNFAGIINADLPYGKHYISNVAGIANLYVLDDIYFESFETFAKSDLKVENNKNSKTSLRILTSVGKYKINRK